MGSGSGAARELCDRGSRKQQPRQCQERKRERTATRSFAASSLVTDFEGAGRGRIAALGSLLERSVRIEALQEPRRRTVPGEAERMRARHLAVKGQCGERARTEVMIHDTEGACSTTSFGP